MAEPDLTELIERDDLMAPAPRVMAPISHGTLIVSMMASAAISALAVVVMVRPARIETALPRLEPQAAAAPAPAPAPAPVVTQLGLAPAPAPAPRGRALHKE